MKIRDLMQPRVATVDDTESLGLALQVMLWSGARHLPVIRSGKVVGILSERDVLRARANAPSSSGLTMAVREAMTSPPECADVGDEVAAVARRMAEGRLGCMPVLEAERLVGIVTTTDLLGAEARVWYGPDPAATPEMAWTAADVMTRPVITAAADDRLADAVDKMVKSNIRHLPVIDGEHRVIGMLSDRDLRLPPELLRHATAGVARRYLDETRVEAVMTRKPLVLESQATALHVLSLLASGRLSALPVVDRERRLVGVVSYIDIIRLQLGRSIESRRAI